MRQSDLFKDVGARAGVSADDARAVLHALAQVVLDEAARGQVVQLPEIGRLRPIWRNERVIRAVLDGRKIALDGRWAVEFRPGPRLKQLMDERSPQLLRDPEHQRAWRLAEALAADLRIYHPQSMLSVTRQMQPEELESACLLAFGSAWSRARARFDNEIPESVRAHRDYLQAAVRRRARA